MSQPVFHPGDTVEYVPDPVHQIDKDGRNQPLFHFVHVKDIPGTRKLAAVKAGDPVDFSHEVIVTGRNEAGHLVCESGHVIRPTTPRAFWPAVVASHLPAGHELTGEPVSVALNADGSVLPDKDGKILLDIPHPSGVRTLHYACPYSTGKAPHTFHRKGD